MLCRLLLVVGFLHGSTALAQPPSDSRDREARALFEAANVAYQDGRFQSAYEHFRQAYALSHRPELLFNIGLAAERARLDREAVDAYRRYLEAVPGAQNRTRVETTIAELSRAVREADRPRAPAPTPTPTTRALSPQPVTAPTRTRPARVSERSRSDDSPVAPWLVVAGGSVLAITGGVLVAVAVSDVSSVENAADGSRWDDVSGAFDHSEGLSIAGFGLIGAGVAGAVAGLVWALSGEPQSEAPDVAITPRSIQLRGRL